ncbi:MAG: protein kinase [Planctomycetes bacterium]|nr:protein kinase [Planctomycetota bacterium]
MSASTTFEEPLDLGRVLIGQGLVSEEAVRECLEIQRQFQRTGNGHIPRLGELLVQRGYVTEKQVVEALATQQKHILYCPRCDIQVNVVMRTDVRKYKCARCEGTLVPPGNVRDLKVADSAIIFISKDPVPKEVVEASKDPARRFGKYILINEIGRGAVGVIHRAWDTYLNQYVALKMIKPPPEMVGKERSNWQETRVLSLFKEARSAVRLRHPNIVPIYDVGRVGRDFFISMEYLEGATLAEHMKKAREEGIVSPFYEDPKKYLRIVRDISRALHYAHTRPAPIIHCDLKPSNVFVDRTGRGYILDFGLAKDLRDVQPDQPGTIRGTPAYMAPEQASGMPEQIDPRTDVYGLGSILYEMLAGRPPFVGDTMDLLRQAIREKPLRPSEVISYPKGTPDTREGTTSRLIKVPEELENVCLKCIEKDRDRRFRNAKEVFEALDDLLKGGKNRRDSDPQAEPANKLGSTTVNESDEEAAAFDDKKSSSPDRPSSYSSSPPGAGAPLPSSDSRPAMAWLWAFAGAALTGTVLLVILLVLRSGRSPWDEVNQTIDARIANFRPDLALLACREYAAKEPSMESHLQSVQTEIDWVDQLRRRLIASISGSVNDKRPTYGVFELRTGTLSNVTIHLANESGLFIVMNDRPQEIAWADIAPAQIAELTSRMLGTPTPAERYGLAVYLEKNERVEAAREEFTKLLGSDFGTAARRHLEQLGR